MAGLIDIIFTRHLIPSSLTPSLFSCFISLLLLSFFEAIEMMLMQKPCTTVQFLHDWLHMQMLHTHTNMHTHTRAHTVTPYYVILIDRFVFWVLLRWVQQSCIFCKFMSSLRPSSDIWFSGTVLRIEVESKENVSVSICCLLKQTMGECFIVASWEMRACTVI